MSKDTAKHGRQANQRAWEQWTPINVASDFYDVAGFKAGRSNRPGLDALEDAALPDLEGKSLLHLQCHFGLDSLRLARRGARVVGADFSVQAIRHGRALATELELDAHFVHSDLYDLPQHPDQHLAQRFDVVFTSHGVLGWLPDLDGWARVIAHYLRPGGTFFVVEAHPFAGIFDDEDPEPGLRVRYPYFGHRQGDQPLVVREQSCYSDRSAEVDVTCHYWLHTLGDIFSALLGAGLQITRFVEYPYIAWPIYPWTEQREDGCWQLPGGAGDVPLMFSLLATRP